jgi:putative ABC transport system substrate-binding protein
MMPTETVADFDGVFLTMARERVDGFLVVVSPLANMQRAPLTDLELKYRLPGIFSNKANVKAGGLMSNGADFNYMYRHAATYVDKILKGERPANIPVEQTSKYELVINLKTAKALGLEIPPQLLARADSGNARPDDGGRPARRCSRDARINGEGSTLVLNVAN